MIIGFTVIVVSTVLFSVISYTNHKRMTNVIVENSLLDTIAYELTGLRADENRLRALSLDALSNPEKISTTDIIDQIEQKQVDIIQKTKGLDSPPARARIASRAAAAAVSVVRHGMSRSSAFRRIATSS